jgi:hypothetical protein
LFNSLIEPLASPLFETDNQEFTPAIPSLLPPPITTTMVPTIPPSSEQAASVEPKAKTKRKSILIKMRLIGQIAIEYFINLFNRNSRDYREVLRKLGEMKSEDKTIQQERIRLETSVGTVKSILIIFQIVKLSF